MSFQDRLLDGKRILIIEDREENRRLFLAILQLEGALVLEAERAQEGVETARHELPDLIVMDVQMPDLDGLSATRMLRADPRTQGIPIVIVTASVTSQDRNAAFKAGCNGFLSKPIEPSTFVQHLATFLSDGERTGS